MGLMVLLLRSVSEVPRPWLVLPLLLLSVPVWPGGPWRWLGPCVPTLRKVRGNREQIKRVCGKLGRLISEVIKSSPPSWDFSTTPFQIWA